MTGSSKSPTPVDFFDAAAEEYGPLHYALERHSFMQTRRAQVLKLHDRVPRAEGGGHALDAGCGPGYLVRDLAQRGWSVSATDAAVGMVLNARDRVADLPTADFVTFCCGDVEKLPFADGVFDLVCSTGVIEYLPDDRQFLSECYRTLRPGGHLILSVTNSRAPSLMLDTLVEKLKRWDPIRRPFNAVWTRLGRAPVRPRRFRVRTHRPADFRRSLSQAGFAVTSDAFFHYLPWPRPLDKLAPSITAAVGRSMERRLSDIKLRGLGEGYVALAQKRRTS